MKRLYFLFIISLSAPYSSVVAQSAIAHTVPAKRQLIDLNSTEASALLTKIKVVHRHPTRNPTSRLSTH